MVTDGSVLKDDILTTGQHDIMFLKSDTGMLTSVVVKNTMIAIKRSIILFTIYPRILENLFVVET